MNVSEFKIWFGDGACATNDLFTALEAVRRDLSYAIERQAREGKGDVVETLAGVLGLNRFHEIVLGAGVKVGSEWIVEADCIEEAWAGFSRGYDAVIGVRSEISDFLQYGPQKRGRPRIRNLYVAPLLERIGTHGFPIETP